MLKDEPAKGFAGSLGREFLEVGKLYLSIFKKPHLLAMGVYHVARDWAYEIPRSIIHRSHDKDLDTLLNEAASASIGLSEMATFPGTFAGVFLAKFTGADDYTASVLAVQQGTMLQEFLPISHLIYY